MNAQEIKTELERLLLDLERPMLFETQDDLLAAYQRRDAYVKETLVRLVRPATGAGMKRGTLIVWGAVWLALVLAVCGLYVGLFS